MTISDTEVFKRAEIPPKDLSDEGKCLLAAQEEANATQTYLNMADNTDDEALKANFEEVAGDEMEHLGKDLMSAAHIRPELAEHMINGAQEAESEGFDIDQAIKDRFAKEDAKKAESTDFDEAIQEHVKRSYPSEEAKIDEVLYEMFSKAKANGATYISDQFLGWLKDTESFKKAAREEYNILSPSAQRYKRDLKRERDYVDELESEVNANKNVLSLIEEKNGEPFTADERIRLGNVLKILKKEAMRLGPKADEERLREYYERLNRWYELLHAMDSYNKYIRTKEWNKVKRTLYDYAHRFAIIMNRVIKEKLESFDEADDILGVSDFDPRSNEEKMELYRSAVEEAFQDPDVKEIMDKIGALGFNPRQIITEILEGSEDMDAKDLLRSRLGSSPESVGKMLRDITESYASGIGQSPEESRKIQEIASRNKGDVYFPESKNKNIYGGVNYNRLGVKSDPRVDALATIMAEAENNYKTRKYGEKAMPIDRETFTPGQKHRQMAFDLMSILGYLFDENDPIRIFDRSKGSKYDLSNLDLLTNKDDTYQKIANEIESAMKGAKKDRLWALMKDPVQPSSLDSIQKWSVGDGMNLGMGWVRDAIYKFAEDVANGNIDLPIPKNKPEGETDERYESAKKAVDELKAGEPMTYGRMQDILGYEATGDAFVNSLNDSNMFGTALNVIRSQLYDEVEKFIGSDGTKRDLLVEKSLPDSNVRDRHLAIMDAIRRKVASKKHLKSFPSLRDVLDAVYEITTNDIKRQRIPSNISDFRKVITLKDKFKDIVDALTAYSYFENISGLKSTYDELEDGVNSLGYKSQKNKKNTKQLRDILNIISKPNSTLSDLSKDQMNYLKTQNIIGSDEGEHTNSDTTTAEDFKKNLIRKVKNAIAISNAIYLLEENKIKQPMDILYTISKPNFTLSDLSEDQMNYLKTQNIIGSDEGEHTNSDTTTAKDFKKNLIRKVKNAIANSNAKYLKENKIKQPRDILNIISKPNFTLSDLSKNQMNYLKIHDIIGSDEGEHTNSDTTTAEDFKKNLIRKVKNAIANSNAEYLLEENKSNLEYVLRTVLGSKGAKLFTELIKIANDKNYLDALDEFERTGSTKKYGWDKSIQVPLGSMDGKTISVPLYEVLNSGLMQNFDKIYDTVMAAVGPVDKNNPVYEGDNSMLMNILQRNKLRRDDKKYVNESNKDRFGYIPHPEYEGKNLDKGEIFALYNDPEKRDEFPLSKKLKAEEYLPSYLRLKGSDLSMSDEFLSSLVFRNRKFSPEEIARITTSDFNTRHIRDIADALSKGQELNETDKALVKLFGIRDMGFESLSNLVKNIDSNTFKKYEESIKKNGYKSVIEDLENKSKTDESVVEDLEFLKATYELISKARNIDDDVRAIYEESVDDFEKRLNEAGESIYEILGSEGAYDKLVQMGKKLYTDFQKEVDYSKDLKKRKTEGDKIKFLERAGVPIGYKDRTGDIKYFKQGDAAQADLQKYFNEMYKNYLDDVKNMGLRDRLNEYYLHKDQDDFVPIKGWSDSSMRLTKKHPLRNISVANALISAMGWEGLDPTKLVMSNKWLKDVDPDRDEISIVKDILDGYVDYFTGDVKTEPKSLLNSLWSMGDNIPPEIEALDANDRAIKEMNESNEKDDTDQEEEDEGDDSLDDFIVSAIRARMNDDEIRQKVKEKWDKINKEFRKEEEVKEMQQKNKKTTEEIKKKKRELDEIEKGIKNEIGEEEWGKMGEGEKTKKIRDEWNKRQEEEMKKNKAKAEKVKEKKKAEKMKMDAKARENIERERKKFYKEQKEREKYYKELRKRKKKKELDEIEKEIKNEIGEEEWGKMGEGEKTKKIRNEWNKRQKEEMKKNKAKAEKVKEKKKFYGKDEPAEIDLSTPEVTPASNNTSSDGGEKVKKEKDSGDAVESTKKSAAKIMNVEGAKTRILDPNLDSEGIHTGKVFPSWQKDSYVISMCDPNVENILPKPPEISNAQPEGATMKTWDIDEAIKERQK